MQILKKLYIEPSSKCNLNCTMCFRNNWFDERPTLMSSATCDRIIQLLQEGLCETVFFGGMGEPLMHPEIYQMISAAKSGGATVELISNATLLDPLTADKLIAAGLDFLWVSMDGFSKESYEAVRRGSLYERIVKNLLYYSGVKKSAKLGITFVMMKDNISELRHINSFADYVQADVVNLSHVVPGEPLAEKDSIYDLDFPVGKIHRYNPAEKRVKEQEVCPFINEDTCFIRSDGEVMPCMQLLHNSDTYLFEEKRKVYAHSFGNINVDDFTKIFLQREFREFRQRVKSFSFPCCTICLGCEDRLENQTDCMYNEKPTCGACLWAQGLIRCP